MTEMQGKTVLITGASRGIGASAARVFAEAGANVALVARSGDAIADLTGELGRQAIAQSQPVAPRRVRDARRTRTTVPVGPGAR